MCSSIDVGRSSFGWLSAAVAVLVGVGVEMTVCDVELLYCFAVFRSVRSLFVRSSFVRWLLVCLSAAFAVRE